MVLPPRILARSDRRRMVRAETESERTARWIGTWTGRAEEAAAPTTTVEFTMTSRVDAGGRVRPPPVTVTIVECARA